MQFLNDLFTIDDIIRRCWRRLSIRGSRNPFSKSFITRKNMNKVHTSGVEMGESDGVDEVVCNFMISRAQIFTSDRKTRHFWHFHDSEMT